MLRLLASILFMSRCRTNFHSWFLSVQCFEFHSKKKGVTAVKRQQKDIICNKNPAQITRDRRFFYRPASADPSFGEEL